MWGTNEMAKWIQLQNNIKTLKAPVGEKWGVNRALSMPGSTDNSIVLQFQFQPESAEERETQFESLTICLRQDVFSFYLKYTSAKAANTDPFWHENVSDKFSEMTDSVFLQALPHSTVDTDLNLGLYNAFVPKNREEFFKFLNTLIAAGRAPVDILPQLTDFFLPPRQLSLIEQFRRSTLSEQKTFCEELGLVKANKQVQSVESQTNPAEQGIENKNEETDQEQSNISHHVNSFWKLSTAAGLVAVVGTSVCLFRRK